MGVRGLTSFIDDNPDLLQDHRLSDCKLVIDGSNFYYFIYYNMNLRFQFGGDYDLFALRVRQVFTVFRDCGVEPYVVFDGAYHKDDRKLHTSLDRSKKRILASDSISRGCHGKVLPYLAYDTFVTVLREMGIHHVTCDQEADDQLVLLANELNCPVMSNDSDFYIFDLAAGFLPTDYVAFEAKKSESGKGKYIPCQIYHVDHFVDCFEGLTKTNLPLAATILGNDYINEEGFSPFFDKLKMPKGSTKKTDSNRRYHKLLKLFHWLASLDQPDTAQQQLLRYVGPKTRESLEEILKFTVDGYRQIFLDFDLKMFFTPAGTVSGLTHLKGYNGSEIPEWLMTKIRKTELPVFMLNAITLHRTILLCQIEHTQSPSANVCSIRLREIIYGILLKDDLQGIRSSPNKDNRQTMVEEYDRYIRSCRRTYVVPVTTLESVGALPGLSDLPSCKKSVCEMILFESLLVDNFKLACIPPSLKLYISCVIYWIKSATPSVSTLHLRSVLICLIYLCVKRTRCERMQKQKAPDEKETDLDLDAVYSASSDKEITTLERNLSKFSRSPQINNKNVLDLTVIHAFSQLQACLYMAKFLNKLLGFPVEDCNPSDVINGTFLYNICCDLRDRSNPNLFISEMLMKRSPFDHCFAQLEQLVLLQLSKEQLETLEPQTSRKKASKRRKLKHPVPKSAGEESAKPTDTEKGRSHLQLKAACKLNNRFSTLSLSDNSDS